MNIVVYINQAFEHQVKWCGAFIEGLKANDITARVMNQDIPSECDMVVMWSAGSKWRNVIADCKKRNRKILIMERGYLGDPSEYASFSLNGLHGLSDLGYLHDIGPDVVEPFKDLIKPWKPKGKHVLLVGQVPGDPALQGLDIMRWLRLKAAELKAAGHKVLYCPDPAVKVTESIGCSFTMRGIAKSFKGAKCVYTHSSLYAIDALLAGKNVVAEGQASMVYELAGHDVESVEDNIEPADRKVWFNELSFRQWSLESIQSGVAFKYLMEKRNA